MNYKTIALCSALFMSTFIQSRISRTFAKQLREAISKQEESGISKNKILFDLKKTVKDKNLCKNVDINNESNRIVQEFKDIFGDSAFEELCTKDFRPPVAAKSDPLKAWKDWIDDGIASPNRLTLAELREKIKNFNQEDQDELIEYYIEKRNPPPVAPKPKKDPLKAWKDWIDKEIASQNRLTLADLKKEMDNRNVDKEDKDELIAYFKKQGPPPVAPKPKKDPLKAWKDWIDKEIASQNRLTLAELREKIKNFNQEDQDELIEYFNEQDKNNPPAVVPKPQKSAPTPPPLTASPLSALPVPNASLSKWKDYIEKLKIDGLTRQELEEAAKNIAKTNTKTKDQRVEALKSYIDSLYKAQELHNKELGFIIDDGAQELYNKELGLIQQRMVRAKEDDEELSFTETLREALGKRSITQNDYNTLKTYYYDNVEDDDE